MKQRLRTVFNGCKSFIRWVLPLAALVYGVAFFYMGEYGRASAWLLLHVIFRNWWANEP